MMMLFAAAVLAAAQPAVPAPPADAHAGHTMHGMSTDGPHGPECADCKSGDKTMSHEGMKDGGCCCCKDMHSDHHDHQATPKTGA
jgi:hypothetical protein